MRIAMQIGLVSLGSALGGLARWGLSSLAVSWLGRSFPYGTFVVNIAGCFLLGCLAALLAGRLVHHDNGWLAAEELRLFLAVGFAGAFTTFSTFQYENHGLIHRGEYLIALAYTLGSMAAGFVALQVGMWLIERW
jgi:CrcB protein